MLPETVKPFPRKHPKKTGARNNESVPRSQILSEHWPDVCTDVLVPGNQLLYPSEKMCGLNNFTDLCAYVA